MNPLLSQLQGEASHACYADLQNKFQMKVVEVKDLLVKDKLKLRIYDLIYLKLLREIRLKL